MIKKIVNVVVTSLSGLMIFVGCSFSDKSNQSNVDNISANIENSKPTEKKQVMNVVDFENLLSNQPVSITNTEYVVQDDSFKALYPDLLTVSIKNDTGADIKNAVISFVAWDENDLPVKIQGQFDFSDSTYVKKINYSDINLVAGGTFNENSGLALNENSKIKTFKAIVKSYETFDGTTWENPYYDEFCSLYEGKKLTDDMSIEVKLEDNNNVNKTPEKVDEKQNNTITAEELNSQLAQQPIFILDTEYVVQDDSLKALYPDFLTASIKNNTNVDIKSAVVSFVAWDENNLPVKIQGQFDFSDGAYLREINYSDINLAAGSTFDKNGGLALNENSKIKTFKAIVKSYEAFDGTTWQNPYYNEFRSLYEGKKLIEG